MSQILRNPFNLELDNISIFKYKDIIGRAKKNFHAAGCSVSSIKLKWSIFKPFKIKARIIGFVPVSKEAIMEVRRQFQKNNEELIKEHRKQSK